MTFERDQPGGVDHGVAAVERGAAGVGVGDVAERDFGKFEPVHCQHPARLVGVAHEQAQVVARGGQRRGRMGSDETRRSCYQYTHCTYCTH